MSITTNNQMREGSSPSNRTEKHVPSLRFAMFSENYIKRAFADLVNKKSKSYNAKLDQTNHICIELESIEQNTGKLLNTFDSSTLGSNKTIFKNGDILFGKLRPYLNKFLIADFDGVCSSEIWVFEAKSILNHFCYFLIQSERYKEVACMTAGSKMPRSNWDFISNTDFYIPTLPEQQKIASFLSSVDSKISLLQEKHSQLQQYKKGVMQQLFSQKLRFTQADGSAYPDWEENNIGFYIEEYTEKTTTQDEYEVLTSSRSGLVSQEDYFENSRISNRENIGFNIIPEGFITYRTRSDDRKFFFNENNLGKTGIISTYYPVFKIKNGSNNFFIHLFLYHQDYIGKYSVGTSQTVLSLNELRKIKLPIPDFKEQQKIAECLMAIDAKIDAVADQLASVQAFKKGLLQKMFV